MLDTKSWEKVEDLVDADGSVFTQDLSGYSAGMAALDLMKHWETCAPPLTTAERVSDVDSVIAVLRRWRQTLVIVALAGYVVTYGGQKVAGPFTLLSDCNDMAKIMAKKYSNVSQVCQAG